MDNQDKTTSPAAPSRRRPGPRPTGNAIDANTRKAMQRKRDSQFKNLDALSTSGLCETLCGAVAAGNAQNTQTLIEAIYRRLQKVIDEKAQTRAKKEAAAAKKEAAAAKKAAKLAAKLAKAGNQPATPDPA